MNTSLPGQTNEFRGRRLTVNKEVKVGDLLTIATILISVCSVLISWSIDRRIGSARQADEIRISAAKTLGALERFEKLSLSLYSEIQPVFVEAAEIVAGETDTSSRVARVKRGRDYLWRRLSDIQASILRRAFDEELDGGYTDLFAYFPETRAIYLHTLERMMRVHDDHTYTLLAKSELEVLDFAAPGQDFQSADVGNSLRLCAAEIRAAHQAALASEMREAEAFLIEKIEADVGSLLKGAGR